MAIQCVIEIGGPGYKLEKVKDFDSSYYEKEYRQAYEVVQTIVNETIHKEEMGTEIQNLVPFIGRRGSGKTSAMQSFVNSLGNYAADLENRYDKGKGGPFFVIKDERSSEQDELDINFICLDSIDGSLLEKGEDIFKLILAKMYNRFDEQEQKSSYREKYTEYDRREIKQQFEKVYRSACSLTNPERQDAYYEESPITSLKTLSSSTTTKAEFGKLVRQYLEMLSPIDKKKYDRKKSSSFLVICIDDLDMSIGNGFDMLEKIHRYMMVEHVIVVLAMDYDQIKTLCEKSFFDMVSERDNRKVAKNHDVYRLAREFLDKVLPASERIYIPDLGKVTNIKVRVSDEQESGEKQLVERPLKEAIFAEVCRRLRMRMDVEGGKRHFYEQNSLRAFVNFYLMLHRMECPGSVMEGERPCKSQVLETKGRSYDYRKFEESQLSDARIRCYDRNYKILMWDTTTRMLDERLEIEYKELFHRITNAGMTHSFRNLYYEMLQRNFSAEDQSSVYGSVYAEEHDPKFLLNLKENLAFYGYSYGEVLRIIFCWGRVDNQSKEMVRCLLAYYSLEMTHSFYHYCYGDARSRISEERRLISTLNGSFAGSWANKMIPEITRNEKSYAAGARKDVNMREVFSLNIPLKKVRLKSGKIEIGSIGNGWSVKSKKDVNKTVKPEVGQLFRTVLLLAMFFEQPHYKADNMLSWRFEGDRESEAEELIRIGDSMAIPRGGLEFHSIDEKANFNVFSFVTNAFSYKSPQVVENEKSQIKQEQRHDEENRENYNIRSVLENLYDAVILDDSGKRSRKEEVLALIGIDEEFDRWREYSKGLALPAYQVDMCYNLMKRVRQRDLKTNEIRSEALLETIKDTFDFMRSKLRKNDEYYASNGISLHEYDERSRYGGMDISYEDAFVKCPFVKWILDEEGKGYLLESFPQLYSKVIESMFLEKYSQETPKGAGYQGDISGYDD